MRFLFLISLILLLGIVSCKRDKLEGERSILEGKWEWVYTIRTESYYNGAPASVDTITEVSSPSTYAIEFSDKGSFFIIENEEIKEEYRTVFYLFESGGHLCTGSISNTDKFTYTIFGDNDEENNRFQGCVSSDSLTCYSKNFPFENYTGANSIVHENFFKKVN
jgi:hypothetical protein